MIRTGMLKSVKIPDKKKKKIPLSGYFDTMVPLNSSISYLDCVSLHEYHYYFSHDTDRVSLNDTVMDNMVSLSDYSCDEDESIPLLFTVSNKVQAISDIPSRKVVNFCNEFYHRYLMR